MCKVHASLKGEFPWDLPSHMLTAYPLIRDGMHVMKLLSVKVFIVTNVDSIQTTTYSRHFT